MKNLKLITLSLLLSLTFFSCDSDDDSSSDEPTTQELLEHKWFIVTEEATACTATSYFDFNPNGALTSETFYNNTVSGNCQSGGLLQGTFVLLDDDETIIFTLTTATIVFKIKEISTTNLLLGSLDDDGVEEGEIGFTR